MNLNPSTTSQRLDCATITSAASGDTDNVGGAGPALPELKRFLDRLLSSPEDGDLPASLQQEHHRHAVALGVVEGNAASTPGQLLPMAELIERTRNCIRMQQRAQPADQVLETMSAPPAMPEATP